MQYMEACNLLCPAQTSVIYCDTYVHADFRDTFWYVNMEETIKMVCIMLRLTAFYTR